MTTSRVEQLNNLIGRPVLSVVSANKLRQVDDLVADSLRGELAGLSVQTLEASSTSWLTGVRFIVLGLTP